jgi:hypothetical protein
MEIAPGVSFTWKPDAAGKQRYLWKRAGNDRAVEAALEELLLAPPGGR